MNLGAGGRKPNVDRRRSGPNVSGHQALCFGDFHLGQQMKVTRLSGRDPTDVESTENPETRTGTETAAQPLTHQLG
jgi:hypothetical protein